MDRNKEMKEFGDIGWTLEARDKDGEGKGCRYRGNVKWGFGM